MISQTKKFVVVILLVVVLVIVIGVFANKPKDVGKFGPFAQCIKDSGAEFYGAFWCPHCQAQKALLENSAKIADVYVECSTPDMKGQTQVCIEKGVTGYPTWDFADGSRANGEQTLEELAEKTGCVLPTTTS